MEIGQNFTNNGFSLVNQSLGKMRLIVQEKIWIMNLKTSIEVKGQH